jgi:choice-of-anchor B domain-containing protein
MKVKLTFSMLIFSCITFAQTLCSSGLAGVYPCSNIDLMSRLSLTQLGGTSSAEGNDIWGWTDPLDNKEYAIIGLTSHTAFVNITNPTVPIYLGKLPTTTANSIWRDIKVYSNHAFIVSEAAGHGLQVFDLTRLRNVTSPQTFSTDALYTGFGNCHNIAINEATGFAYAVGTTTYNGGPHIVNIQNPTNPILAGGYGAQNYTHDAQIVVYNGPDAQHVGKEIFFGANESKVVVVDVTNKANPILLSTFFYANTAYAHQGWLTNDHKHFLLGDELDESTFGFNTKTVIIDMTDLDLPVLKSNYFGATAAIDHNGYVKGNEFYLANYRAGFRLIDITNINSGPVNEVGFFDTFPTSNSNSFNGAWSVYPYFASGNIIISDIERGLFVLRKAANLSNESFVEQTFTLFPNPSDEFVKITSKETINTVAVFSNIGQEMLSFKNINSNEFEINLSQLSSGFYIVVVNKTSSKKLLLK